MKRFKVALVLLLGVAYSLSGSNSDLIQRPGGWFIPGESCGITRKIRYMSEIPADVARHPCTWIPRKLPSFGPVKKVPWIDFDTVSHYCSLSYKKGSCYTKGPGKYKHISMQNMMKNAEKASKECRKLCHEGKHASFCNVWSYNIQFKKCYLKEDYGSKQCTANQRKEGRISGLKINRCYP